VNRLVSLVILVTFVVQQFACCCGELALYSRSHDHPANAHRSCVYTYKHTHPPGDHHHAPFDHDHKGDPGTDKSDASGPDDRSHQHHVCIGTHVFFVSAPRTEMPKQDMGHGFHFVRIDVLNHLAMAVRTASGHHGVDYGPPLSSCPQRSALCIYRI
jgi:hypothetical protein